MVSMMMRPLPCATLVGVLCSVAVITSARAERPDGVAGSSLRRLAAAQVLWIWPSGSTLESCFVNGTQDERKLVIDAASEWSMVAALQFDFGAAPDFRTCPQTAPFPHVRISFGAGAISHARLGTFAIDHASAQPNMFIATMFPSRKPREPELVKATIMHEFGHVLGLKHEHQHPESACFHMVAWTQMCARREPSLRLPAYIVTNWLPMIGRANPDYLAGWPYDPLSIMHYKFPARVFSGPATTCAGARNMTLSGGDRAKVSKLYPPAREAQQAMIRAQAPLIANAILQAGDIEQGAAERIAREGERIVRLAHQELADFRIEVSAGLEVLRQSGSDRGTASLRHLGTGQAEAAIAACANAETAPLPAPPGTGKPVQNRREPDEMTLKRDR